MKLKIIESNSRGNCYILEGNKESLIVECGVGYAKLQRALDFNLSRVVGCLISHSHKDHCRSAYWVAGCGIDVYASQGTLSTFDFGHHRCKPIEALKKFSAGEFQVIPFAVEHDAPEPLGFLIKHPEAGIVLFMTDTIYTRHTFAGVDHYIIEANYDEELINERADKFVRDRVLNSHMSLETCKDFLAKSDTSKTKKIILIHLSENNADPVKFKRVIEETTGRPVVIAESNSIIDL